MSRRGLIVLLIALTVCTVASAQNIEEQAITSAYNYLAIQDFERAYSFVNFVLQLNAGEQLEPQVRNLAESVYFNYLQVLLAEADYRMFEEVKLNLANYPQVNSVRIQQLVENSEARIAAERQAQLAEQARQRELEADKQRAEEEAQLRLLELQQQKEINDQLIELQRLEVEQLARRDDILEADLESRSEIAELNRQQQQDFNQALLTVVAADRSESGLSTTLIIVLAGVGVIVLLGFGLLAFMFLRNSQQQQEFFQYTISQVNQPREVLSLPMYTAPVADRSHQVEFHPDRKLLPAGGPKLEGLKDLMQRCREISAEIDERTRRRNATRNVAELVYKISTFMGYEEAECMLFLAVGMVYDIGFLQMEEALFEQTKLTEEQFELLKTHTTLGQEKLGFVPEEYRPIFEAGVLKHHENLDGTGYPKGISGDEIPYIARAIHAAESFIAMTSQREFREIMNKTDAVAALMQDTDKYDPDIIYAITNVV